MEKSMSTNSLFKGLASSKLIHTVLAVLMMLCTAQAVDGKKAAKQAVPSLGVYGGYGEDPFTRPFLLSWKIRMHVFGGNWKENAQIKLHFRGPMNNLTIPPTDHVLGTMFTDAFGSINGTIENTGSYFDIPYDNGVQGQLGTAMPNILPPGHYQVFGVLDDPIRVETATVSGGVELLPQTDPELIDWGRSRGFRTGFLGDHSPEFLDPEWVTVWSKRPIGLYGTIAETNDEPNNQPMLISHHEAPGSHYAHDGNLMVLPDSDYRWVLGIANLKGEEDDKEVGRLELEWEIQNNYSPLAYGQGVVGMPLWVHATGGDRIYTVGQWVMDGGHRGEGYRTEIHPPRLLAVMRKNHTAVPLNSATNLIPAKQVDIYVSGHGGGISHYYDGLEDLLDRNGQGGGRLEDFMTTADDNKPVYGTYFQYGPGDGTLVAVISEFLEFASNETVYPIAGPSAMATDLNTGLPTTWDHSGPPPANLQPWVPGPEERPINDMDYDFDVVLPAPPSPKVFPRVLVETHPEHTTSVNETITFIDPDPRTDLPRKAHIHLPYNGADNGIYARTLKFSWSQYSWPGRHFRVKIDEVTFFQPDGDLVIPFSFPWNQFTGKDVLWVNVCGQWRSLTEIRPADFLSGIKNRKVRFGDDAPVFDVFLNLNENMMIYSYGYDRCALESKYVTDIGKPPYEQGASIIDSFLETGDNKKLGAVFFDRVPSPLSALDGGLIGQHFAQGGYTANSEHFYDENYTSGYVLGFTISQVQNPHADVSPSSVNFGDVVLGSTSEKKIRINNLAENWGAGGFAGIDDLHVTPSATGDGFSVLPNELFGVEGQKFVDVTVKFAPTTTTQGTGSVTLITDDVSAPTITVPLKANVLYPELSLGVVNSHMPPTVVGCTLSQTVTVKNTGTADLLFKPTISGAGYTLSPYSGDANGKITLAPTASINLTMNFAPTSVSRQFPGTITFVSNDPINPTKTLSFCGEGVRAGIRVLVLKPNGVPYASVDQMTLTQVPKTTQNWKKLPLTTIAPPISCRVIQYQLEQALPATNPDGHPGVAYNINVRIGNSSKSTSFTLGPCDFKEIVVTLP